MVTWGMYHDTDKTETLNVDYLNPLIVYLSTGLSEPQKYWKCPRKFTLLLSLTQTLSHKN